MQLVLILSAVLGLSLAAPHIQAKPRDAPSALYQDLQELIELLPVDDILEMVDMHIGSDGALASVIEYLQGPDWRELVDTVLAKPSAVAFIEYLNDAGIPVDDILTGIREWIAGAQPGVEADPNGSLRVLLDHIEEMVPADKLLTFVFDKLQSAPEVQDLYKEISSDEAFELVEEVRNMVEVQRLLQRLRDLEVRIDETLEFIYAFLGWEYKPIS